LRLDLRRFRGLFETENTTRKGEQATNPAYPPEFHREAVRLVGRVLQPTQAAFGVELPES
jgi:hypothetical protein